MIHAKQTGDIIRIYRSLPTDYFIGRTKINLKTASVEIQQSQGFYEVVEATIGANQEKENLIPSDLVDNQYIERVRNFTQQEIDDKIALDLVNQNNQEVENQLNKGRTLAIDIFVFVRKHTGLTVNQKSILKALAILLYQGDIEQSIIDFGAISRPATTGKMQSVYDYLETKFNEL